MNTHELEQIRARALRREAQRAIPDRFDRWPAIRERALAVRAEASGGSARTRRQLQRALGPALVAGVLVVALLAMLSLRPGRNQPASAQEIFLRAQLAAAASPTNAAESMNYHLTAVQQFGPGVTLPDWAAGTATLDVERWHAANGALREENVFRDSKGALLLTQGAVRNADNEWLYYVYQSQTDALHWSAASAPSAEASPPVSPEEKATMAASGSPAAEEQATANAAGASAKMTYAANASPLVNGTPVGAEPQKTAQPADATPDASGDAAFKETAIAGRQSPPPATVEQAAPLWSVGDTSNAANLDALLSNLAQQGCGQAERQADETIAGRAVYVIKVISDGSCPKLGASGEQLLVRVDQQTFVTLGWEQHAADGALLGSYAVTSIEYGAQFPADLFSYTPPSDANVCALDGSDQYPTCQSKGPQPHGTATP